MQVKYIKKNNLLPALLMLAIGFPCAYAENKLASDDINLETEIKEIKSANAEVSDLGLNLGLNSDANQTLNQSNPMTTNNYTNNYTNNNLNNLNIEKNDDTLEYINRPIFAFNQKLDQYFLKPIAKTYKKITPEPIQKMVGNFLGNIDDVYSSANHLLQGNVQNAVQGTARVAFNSVLGLGGLIDIAGPAGLIKKPQDFGETLGKWGVPSGPYLVLPALGPSTVRDTVGKIATMQVAPTKQMNGYNAAAYTGVKVIDTRTNLLDATRVLDEVSIDPYLTMKNIYLQHKNKQTKLNLLSQKQEDESDLDDGFEPDTSKANLQYQ